MSFEKAKEFLRSKGYDGKIIVANESTSTVELAAKALGTECAAIAKTLSFITPDGPILVIVEGTGRIDNRKFKDAFHTKATMIPYDSVETLIGHAPGGVCPFGINEGIPIYLDITLKKHEYIYPAAGDASSAVKLTLSELKEILGVNGFVDVCKEQ